MRVIDMHCDTISRLYEERREGNPERLRENTGHLDLVRMKEGDYLLQNFALYTNLEREKDPYTYCRKLVELFNEEMEANSDWIRPARSYEDILKNETAGRMSALLTIEEGAVCRGDLRLLREFYEAGVRMMTLTWNYKNELAFPNKIGKDGKAVPNTEDGLTETGIEFVKEMERLGMIVDVSHLGDAGIWDVFRYTDKPFVASHSNARALASHPRNMTDEMIKKLAERGGVMGINYCAAFLRDHEDGEEARVSRVSDMVEHIKYIKKIGGIGCVGLGSDYDGIGSVLEMKSPAELFLLENKMREEGFTESETEAVFYKNVLRVYQDILK